jgi:hypothetical protein
MKAQSASRRARPRECVCEGDTRVLLGAPLRRWRATPPGRFETAEATCRVGATRDEAR